MNWKRTVSVTAALLVGLFVVVTYLYVPNTLNSEQVLTIDKSFKDGIDLGDKRTTNQGRVEYFHRLLKDPVTQEIPENIRKYELEFAEQLSATNKRKGVAAEDIFEWTEVGPFDVGGRTRGFGIDPRNTDIMIAGSASGGVWKSTDGGTTWAIKSVFGQNLGVSDLVQDPLNQDTWYYSTAELIGSADDQGNTASFYGSGMFISTDNGENWAQIEPTRDNDNSFNSQYDFVQSMTISPVTGTILYSSNALGIFRSTNQLQSSSYVLGITNNHIFAEVEFNADGDAIAVLSSGFAGFDEQDPGVYISSDDGQTWTDITPNGFPSAHDRSVIGISESDPDVFYVLTDVDGSANNMELWRFDISDTNNIQSSDRSANIPNYGGNVGELNPQFSYNLVCKVHPSNSDIVFIGGTNLYRSTDGFSTTPSSNVDVHWIGGYDNDNDISQYEGQHPDQHHLVFDPNNPNRAISLHDGGISVTNDITATPVVWDDLDEGYNVTQFYTVSIHPGNNDSRILGGTQDNGSPYFLFDLDDGPSNSVDPSSGDGAFNFLGNDIALTSSQNGFLLRYIYNGVNLDQFSYVYPSSANNQLFIHPVAVNHVNENFVAYPESNHLWIQDEMVTQSRNLNSNGTSTGWTELNNVTVGNNHEITALEFSTSNPAGRLYFGGSSDNFAPEIRRFDDVTQTDGEVDISMPGADIGAYVHDIAVHPTDGDQVIVVLSNYNIQSVWYSSNAGSSWTSIGGNIDGENGPSVRTAAFAPTDDANYVFIGTSTGLYYTDLISGSSTEWTQVGEETIGNVVIADLDYRIADDFLAVGTHGRGLFIGDIGVAVSNEEEPVLEPETFTLQQNYPNPFNPSTNIEFTLASNSRVTLTVFDVSGREIARILENESMSSGSYTELFDATNLASGTYLYRLDAIPISGGNSISRSKTMTLIK